MKSTRIATILFLFCCFSSFAATNRFAINNGLLQSTLDANNNSVSNVANLQSSNVFAGDVIIGGQSETNRQTKVPATIDGFDMLPATQAATNLYWWDFGKTNGAGQKLIYATLLATNDIRFLGVTNISRWSLLSFNVIASGANRTMYIPSSLPHFQTNGWVLGGSHYVLILTNGNEFRMTIQSNNTLSTTWAVFGQ